MSGIEKVTPTTQHLIVEYTSTESITTAVLPSLKFKGFNLGGPRHLQVMRYVYTIVEADDIYFEGRRLEGMPGVRELFLDWIRPGEQLVSVPNGKFSVMTTYIGKKNIAQAHSGGRTIASVPLGGYIDMLGDDPAPEKVLYGNPAVTFQTRGGDGVPTAAAYYNTATRRFEPVNNVDQQRLLPDFLRRFGRREVPAN